MAAENSGAGTRIQADCDKRATVTEFASQVVIGPEAVCGDEPHDIAKDGENIR